MLTLNPYFDIKDINLQNHTATVNLNLEVSGIKNVTINGISKQPNIICIQLGDSNNNEVNLTLAHDFGNGTYSYQGNIADENWYLYSMGEGYPYDVNAIEFRVLHLDYFIGDTRYGATAFDDHTFQIGTAQSTFFGLNYVDLAGSWQIENKPNGEVLDILFARGDITPSFIIIMPLAWLLTIIVFSPTFTKDRGPKITLYSTVLVFAPMFIFAIQAFIPSRASPSIAEFLGVTLLLLSASLLIAVLPKFKKNICLIMDISAFITVAISLAVLFPLVFFRLIGWWLPVQLTLIGLETLLITGLIARIAFHWYEQKHVYDQTLDY